MEEIVENPAEVFLLDKFESLFLKMVIAYLKTCEDPTKEVRFEKDYYEKYIKEPLTKEYLGAIQERIKTMKKKEIYDWLTISSKQFDIQRHERYDLFQEKFLQEYWFPDDLPEENAKISNSLKYYEEVLRGHFYLYPIIADITQHFLLDFKNQYYGIQHNSNTDNTSEPKKKLKTNLTVKEIAYLFRALHDEGIIEARQKTDIFNFIAENFSSKQKEHISANSIKNAFDTPDPNAVDLWQEKFTHFMQKAKKDKEK